MTLKGDKPNTHREETASPEWLLVMGTDRNAGKTTLICELIRKYGKNNKLTAIKISPHFHPLTKDSRVLRLTEDHVIVEETRADTGKDSARMLQAGAARVLYVQVWDENLDKAMEEIKEFINPGSPVICESGWARKLIRPGVFAIVNRQGNYEMKDSIIHLKPLADAWFEFDGRRFDPSPGKIILKDGRWYATP